MDIEGANDANGAELYNRFRIAEKRIRKLGVTDPPKRGRKANKKNQGCSNSRISKAVVDFLKSEHICNFSTDKILIYREAASYVCEAVPALSTIGSSAGIEVIFPRDHVRQSLVLTSICPSAKAYKIDSLPNGFFIIRGALSRTAQVYWAMQAVERYSSSEHTNLTNLEKMERNEHDHDADGIDDNVEEWQKPIKDQGFKNCNDDASKAKYTTVNSASSSAWEKCVNNFSSCKKFSADCLGDKDDDTRRMKFSEPIISEDMYEHNGEKPQSNYTGAMSQVVGGKQGSQQLHNDIEKSNVFREFNTLRWASLGYHYNWTDRKYMKDLTAPIPPDFARLCESVANFVGWPLQAEAAIINYYPLGTNMSGHVDDAEHCLDEPIVSFSLGCPAIFLIGGLHKSDEPTPILLRSGDAIVMAGESRKCYHGVPLILKHGSVGGRVPRQQDDTATHSMPALQTPTPTPAIDPNCDNTRHAKKDSDANDDIEDDLSRTENPELNSGETEVDWCCDICKICDELANGANSQDVDEGSDNDEENITEKNASFCLAMHYLQQARINLNARRVTHASGVWIDKCGTGASMTSNKCPPGTDTDTLSEKQ